MKSYSYTIADENGIHARPAGLFAKLAKTFSAGVSVTSGGGTADGKKLFALMGLCVKKGDTITVAADGPDEDRAAAEIESFLKTNL